MFHYSEVYGEIDVLDGFEQIVVNTVASAKVISFLERLLSWASSRAPAPEIIIGTEYSWGNRVKSGDISPTFFDQLYRNHLILRHTARTDARVYEDENFYGARIQEFELGIHQDALPAPDPIIDRKGILLVAAPEGRVTKNNEEIYETEKILSEADLGGRA